MDEPTSGMDPGSRRLVWDNVKAAVAQGQSVMMTSHSMAECDILCDRLAFMANGKLKCTGNPNELKEKFGGGYKISMKLKDKENFEEVNKFLVKNLKKISFISQREKWLNYMAIGNISEILGFLSLAKDDYKLEGFTINMTSLDDIFMEVTNNGYNENFGASWTEEVPALSQDSNEYMPGGEAVQAVEEPAVYTEPDVVKEEQEDGREIMSTSHTQM